MSTVKGYKPHDKQREIHDAINYGHEKYYALNIGRQFGKTLLGINQLLWWAINDKGCRIAWVTPVYKQGKKVFADLERAVVKSNLFTFNRSDLMVSGFGSTIEFFSGERPDNIRGNTFDYMVVDEMAFTRPELWDEVLSATVMVKGKKVIFISTPKGKNHFHRICMQHNYDERYAYHHYSSYDNPMIDPRELDERRRSLPDHVFKQEYLAEFIDNASGLFKNVAQCVKPISPGSKRYAGLDIGRADDYTVLNNLIVPFTTTSKSKQVIIEDLAIAFEQMEISLQDESWLVDELENFTYIYNVNTRAVQYSAPIGMHDDGVMSLALAWHCRKTQQNKGRYQVIRA